MYAMASRDLIVFQIDYILFAEDICLKSSTEA